MSQWTRSMSSLNCLPPPGAILHRFYVLKFFRCCMHHDKCYDAAVDARICYDVAWEYIDGYKWKCGNGTAICEGGYCATLPTSGKSRAMTLKWSHLISNDIYSFYCE